MAHMGLRRPVLVGWSLGGRVIRQYLIHHGDADLAGINIVAARPIEHPSVAGAVPAATDETAASPLEREIRANIAFLLACYATPPTGDDFTMAVAFNMMLPSPVREAIEGWSTPAESVIAALRAVRVPTLISHGRLDQLIMPAAAEMTAAHVPHARISWFENCGHSPFYEDAPRFNRELAAFVASAWSRQPQVAQDRPPVQPSDP
jgi:non-heme chloroperoxidase